MHVSFIIPLFGRLDLTQACLASLRATMPGDLEHEIILVDDGSPDHTREWLRTLGPPYRVLCNERNLGYAASNNRGAAAAAGECLVLLNNDLVLRRRWLEPMLAPFRRAGSVGFVGNVQINAATRRLDHAGIAIDEQCRPVHARNRFVRLSPRPYRRVPAVTGACLVVPRRFFLELGGFDEGFHNGGEDIDLCFRIRARGLVGLVALRSVIWHHVSASAGRKQYDEVNSRRLARRWRDELMALSLRAWCRSYLARHLPEPRDYDRTVLRECAAFLLHLRRDPPAAALLAQEQTMREQEERWTRLLGPQPDAAGSAISHRSR